MTSKSIEVIVASDGGISIEAHGFTGGDCEKATQFLEEALGQAASRQRKPEYYRSWSAQQKQRLGG